VKQAQLHIADIASYWLLRLLKDPPRRVAQVLIFNLQPPATAMSVFAIVLEVEGWAACILSG
jgi:hypothetical protein